MSTLTLNSVIIDLKNVLYVSNESLKISLQYCNLSSTIVHCRSLPLSDGDNSDKGLIEHVIQVHMKFRRQSLINYIIKVKDSKLLPEILSHTQRLTLLSCSCLILIFLHIINYFIHYVQPEPNLVWLNRVDVVEPLFSST